MNNKNLPELDGMTILLVDDDPAIIRSLGRSLRGLGATLRCATSLKDAENILSGFRPEAVLSDLQLSDGKGLELISTYLSEMPQGNFYLLTGYGSVENAVESIKAGVKHYFQKPVDPIQLARQLLRDLPQPEALQSQLSPYLLYQDALMAQTLSDLPQLAASLQPVLIQGESGTGKELIARALHELSPCSEGPFVAVNCGAIPESLLEDELFGHEKGAFTGAQKMRKGHFERAHKGTLFLDEIGEMPLAFQVRLLRVLEDGKITRIGSENEITVQTRIIAATHRDLEKDVSTGLFRQDLWYRLNVLSIQIPPLRQRLDDISLLANHFLHRAFQDLQKTPPWPTLENNSLALLRSYHWPGNVRELRNIMTRLAIRLPEKIKTIEPQWIKNLLPADVVIKNPDQTISIPSDITLEEVERLLIQAALEKSNGNRIKAAMALGIGERTLRRKLNNR